MNTPIVMVMAGVLSSALATGAAPAAKKVTARERYYEAAKSDKAEWIGLRSSFLLRRASGDETTVDEVGEDFKFRTGDRFKIRLQSNFDGFLYVLFQQGDSYRLLFPQEDSNDKGLKLRAFESRNVPGTGKEWFRFDRDTGLETAIIVIAPSKIHEFESAGKRRTISQSVLESIISKNGPTRSMRFDEEDGDETRAIAATYYVEKRPADANLVRRIELIHAGK